MVFSSFSFLLFFLPIILIIYYKVKSKRKNAILFIGSLFFYAWGEPVWVVLMIFSILNDYVHALLIHKFKKENKSDKSKLTLISSIIVNIFILFYFKYSHFLIENINLLFDIDIVNFEVKLPIGISFYTFQTMSYTIDVYRGKVNVQKNILNLGTYVALFPQLIAGPIVRYIDIENQIEKRIINFENISCGMRRFIIGLGKKIILANSISIIASYILNNDYSDYGVLVTWIGVIAFSLQIYFDFSGYSDMAIGLGKMLGFNFPENFDYPYVSKSITQFWKRWHISLGMWFRDYVYIPLGGNRVSSFLWLRNVFIVWFLTGLWHGASWNYVIWGLYYGVILVLEKYFLKFNILKLRVINHIYTIVVFLIGWVIFAIEDISQGFSYIIRMFGVNGVGSLEILRIEGIIHYIPYLIIGIFGTLPIMKSFFKILEKHLLTAIVYDLILICILAFSIVYLTSTTFNPFIYFKF